MFLKTAPLKTLPASFLFFLSLTTGFAQHQHDAKAEQKSNPLSFAPVFATMLTDPELKDYKMDSSLMTVAPGGQDTVAHRHDAELFGYIVEGKVEIGLDKGAPKTYSAGQMFYEKRKIMHSLTRNPDPSTPAKVLIIFIIKNGRPGYTKEYK
ncbi:cupin domain-containing protein [Larkinella terrae]|uniref:Cupin domain-containing protein n=1 Tax=Larkinella terrae TaxID=2025311 RepID=A0A7K0EKI2_9BACT|nr:cupin domain-containing protein [Larkinella terrae]MRS62232.1 cupin domain-containing protein [Larkinella terrae]